MELGEKQDFSRLKFPASGKSLKEEPAWCAQEMTELKYVGRMSEEEVEKISGVKVSHAESCRFCYGLWTSFSR